MASILDIKPDPQLEVNHFHLLSSKELAARLDEQVEAVFMYGYKIRKGIGTAVDEELGWTFIERAARRGHPLAIGMCLFFGQHVKKDLPRAVQIIRQACERGYPPGMLLNAVSNLCY
jgi:TPR repeat protein